MFDCHLEKPVPKMTPGEKPDYIRMQMMFKWQIRNRVIIENSNKNKNK